MGSDDKILEACKAMDQAFESLKAAKEGVSEARLMLLIEAQSLLREAIGKAEDGLFTA